MSITVKDVKPELDAYIHKNLSVLSARVYNELNQVDSLAKTITKVKGKYPQYHQIMGRVVQGYEPVWNAMGSTKYDPNVLENFRQKVNYEINVDDVYGTWLSDLKVEGKLPKDQPISKKIIDELFAKVYDDIADLSVTGIYDEAKAHGNFGYSLNGLNTLIRQMKTNTKKPCFSIPLEVITDANMLDQMIRFERSLPEKQRSKIKKVVMSENNKIRYGDLIVEKYGAHTGFNSQRIEKTETFKYEIIGLKHLGDDIIYCSLEDNFVKLIDKEDKPRITDTQVQDYVLKIFMEFHLGYGFCCNHGVYVAEFDPTKPKGLGDPAKNKLYYPMENLN